MIGHFWAWFTRELRADPLPFLRGCLIGLLWAFAWIAVGHAAHFPSYLMP